MGNMPEYTDMEIIGWVLGIAIIYLLFKQHQIIKEIQHNLTEVNKIL